MRKTIILFAGLLLMHQFSVAQDDQSDARRVRLSDFYIQGGFFGERGLDGSIGDFRRLAPQSTILQQDFQGYSESWAYHYGSRGLISLMLGMQFRDKNGEAYRSNPRLRLGLTYSSGTLLSSNIRRQDRYEGVDTYVSQNTGHVIRMDSVIQRSLDMRMFSEQIHLDASLIFSTNPQKRITLFSGLGVTGGVSINSSVRIIHYERSNIEPARGDDYRSFSLYRLGGEDRIENFKAASVYGLSTYVPLGIDFRLGKENEFWKLLHLFYEARPSLHFTFIPDAPNTSAVLQHSIGIRVGW